MTELESVPSGELKPLPKLPNGDLGLKPFMIEVMQERFDAITTNSALIQSNPWTTTKSYYNLRKMLDKLGYNVAEEYPKVYPQGHKKAGQVHPQGGKVILDERRPYIQGQMLTDICEKEFKKKRHQLGIFVDEVTRFYYMGESYSVGFDDIDSLAKKGTDFVLAEKAYAVKPVITLAEPYGIALLECGGNFVEYARILCEKAVRRGCNVALLTDFDIPGLAMCLGIPWATRIGIDDRILYELEFTEEQIRLIQERYNPNPDQITYITTALKRYNDGLTADPKGEPYNLDLLRTLNLGQHRSLEYLKTTRIELDHVIDTVIEQDGSPNRFFEYLKKTMEARFPERDYNPAVESPYLNELYPPVMKEFVARMDKLVDEIPALQPKLREIRNKLRNNKDGLKEIDKFRQERMIDPLVETEEANPNVKRLLSNLSRIMKIPNLLPELTEEEKLNL